MKKFDEICQLFVAIICVAVIFLIPTFLVYDGLSGNFWLIHYINGEKKTETAEIITDTISVDSYRIKQTSKFHELIRKLTENPDFFKKIDIDLSYGSDPISMKRTATAEMLSKWNSYDFICLRFPYGLSIHCDNYDKKKPEFFAKITTERETSYGFSQISVPYYMAETGKESVSEAEEQKYVLEAIENAISTVKQNTKVAPRKCYSCKK